MFDQRWGSQRRIGWCEGAPLTSLPAPCLLGYRPRRPWTASAEFKVPGVVAVASASDCITDTVIPRDLEPDWPALNSAMHYPTIQAAVQAGERHATNAEIHATLLFPVVFFDRDKADEVHVVLKRWDGGGPVAEPLPPVTSLLGLDVVSLGYMTRDLDAGVLDCVSFDCAPLSCNGVRSEERRV